MKRHSVGTLFLAGLCVLSSFALFGCDQAAGTGNQDNTTETKSDEFDENNIVLTFSAMSDIHQQMNKTAYADMLLNALDYSKELNNGNDLDLALFSGDLTEETWRQYNENYGDTYNADVAMLKQTLEEGLDLTKTAVFYALGNHDTDSSSNKVNGNVNTIENWSEHMASMPSLFYNQLGESFFTADCADSDPENGLRHAEVNGYHFLSVQPDKYWTLHGYSQTTLDWVDAKLAELTAADPDQYVFVTAHPPEYGSVFVSYTNDWADMDLDEVLSKYPQVIYLSGHIHNVLQDEIQLSQSNGYTKLDCGSVKYTGVMNKITDSGGTFDNSVGTRIDDFSQGLFLQVDVNGNLRVTRCDYYKRSIIKQPWEFSYPKTDKSHLLKYDDDLRQKNNTAPQFEESATLTVTRFLGNAVTCTWDAAVDDDMVRYYRLTTYLVSDGKKTKEKTYYLATFTYQYDQVEEMPDTMTYSFTLETDGEYYFECVPVDIWNATGGSITATLSAASSG